jgi:hypothetical protein
MLLFACSSIEGMVYFDDFENYEAADAEKMMMDLPGNLHFQTITFEEDRISVNYDSHPHTDHEHHEEESVFWEKDDQYKKILLLNASLLLKENSQTEMVMVFLNTETQIYSIYLKREDIKNILGIDDFTLSVDDLKSYIDDEAVQAYYKDHPPLIMSREDDC